MSTSILKIKNPTTGEWKEIPAIMGPTGPAGPQGQEGAQGETGPAGKNAYQYAQEGGYTGTEEEFANKLAKDNILYVDFTDNGDGTYQASKNVVEVWAAHAAGIDIKARITYDGAPLIVPIFLIGETYVGYGGASDNMTIYILHQGLSAQVSIKELALQTDVDAMFNAIQEMSSLLGGKIPYIDHANVEQVLRVASVDENGVPSGWQAIDLPTNNGGSVTALDWEYINTLSFVKDDGVVSLYCSETADGNPFEYDEILIMNQSSDYGGSANIWCNRETIYFSDCAQIKSFLAFGNKKYCLLKSLLIEDNIQWILAQSTYNDPVLYNIVKDSGAMRTDGKITSVCVAKPNTSDNAQATLQFYGRNYK